MNAKARKFVRGLGILLFVVMCSCAVRAQETGATLSGTIKDPSGAVVPNAKVSVKNLATQQTRETQTDSQGHYSVANLTPGEYELSVLGQGYSTNVTKLAIETSTAKTVDVTLGGVLSLGDLGFAPAQTQGSTQEQARLDKPEGRW
jgi:Carboxypeptidase regulatory-like domain